MVILDGKKTSSEVKEDIKEEVSDLYLKTNKKPHLVAVLVGDDGASLTYVNAKIKSCKEVGFKSSLLKLSTDISQENLLSEIDKLNKDENVNGFIVQLPLPKHINEEAIIMAICPTKDIDGFHPQNLGKMMLKLDSFLPATPYGILELLKRNHIDTDGKHSVIIGRSNIVGMPMSLLLSRKHKVGNSTVTITHSRTRNISEITKTADIIIIALGIPHFLKEDMVKEGVVVIDVGITRVEDASKKNGFKLLGDVDFDKVSKKASYITPVPGGVGPMTIAMLMKNTLKSFKNNI